MLNNVSLDSYSIFKEVYENRNIAQTAAKLNVSASSISYRIKLLEESLNIKLFERKSSGVEPTPNADELYCNIKLALDMIMCAERNIVEMESSNIGNIYIGLHYNIDKMMLIPIINEFSRVNTNIRIHVIEKNTADLVKLLEKNKLDMIIDFIPVSSDKIELNVDVLYELHTCFVKIKGAPNKYILPNVGSTIRTQLDSYLQNNNIVIPTDYEVCTNEMIINMVNEKLGIGYIAKEYVDDKISESIEYVDVLSEYPVLQVCVVYSNKNTPNSVKKFINLLKERTK